MQRDQDILYRFEAQVGYHPVGVVPEGLRITVPFEGRITAGRLMDGPYRRARVWGIDHLLLRRDGVGVIDAPKTVSAGDRHFFEHVRGYCLPPAGLALPPLEAILAPDFRWPDLLFAIHGFSQFRTADPELQDLNRAHAVIDGWASFASGQLVIETRLVEHRAKVAGPPPVMAGAR
ncbi:MAG: hypothetical protein R6X25_09215 [Candidatus Krumholzibacteriia bacterium]